MDQVTLAERALSAAILEDSLLWSADHGSQHHRLARDESVALARDAGMSLQKIASGVGVTVGDVERMLSRGDAHNA